MSVICYLMTVSPQNASSVLFHTVVNRCKYSGLLPGFVQFKRLDTCTVCPLLSCCNILPASCLLSYKCCFCMCYLRLHKTDCWEENYWSSFSKSWVCYCMFCCSTASYGSCPVLLLYCLKRWFSLAVTFWVAWGGGPMLKLPLLTELLKLLWWVLLVVQNEPFISRLLSLNLAGSPFPKSWNNCPHLDCFQR